MVWIRTLLHSPLVDIDLQSTKHLHTYDPLNPYSNPGGMIYDPRITEETGSERLCNLPEVTLLLVAGFLILP